MPTIEIYAHQQNAVDAYLAAEPELINLEYLDEFVGPHSGNREHIEGNMFRFLTDTEKPDSLSLLVLLLTALHFRRHSQAQSLEARRIQSLEMIDHITTTTSISDLLSQEGMTDSRPQVNSMTRYLLSELFANVHAQISVVIYILGMMAESFKSEL